VLNPIVVLFFITCCSSGKNPTDDLVCIDISKNFPEKEIILTDIADVEYLYLSSDDDDYLYSGTITYITKNTVVVYCRTSGNILFFSKDGKPKSRFNRKGQGPEDYINAMAVIYDEATDDVFVNRMRDILVYSSAGVYKRKITLPQGTVVDGRIVSFDENSLFLYDLGKESNREIRVLSGEENFVEEDNVTSFYRISKTDGEVLDYVEIPYVPIFLGIYVDGQRISSRYKRFLVKCPEGAFLCSLETDTIFLYRHDKSLTPVLYKTPSLTSTNPIKHLNNCLDRGQYQFIEVCTVQAGDEYPGVFPVTNYMRNKNTGEICCPKFLLPDYKGKEFIISPSNGFLYDSGVYFELDIFELKQAYHDNKLSGMLKELVATLNEDEDNNVFALFEFK
jgi:hypothetical protein